MSGITLNCELLLKALQLPKKLNRSIMKVGTIPNTTLIRGKQTGEVIITAPATETKLQGIGSLPYFIMADAKILHNIVSRLPESEEVLIDCVDNQIVFRINAYQLKYTPLKIEKL